MVASALALLGMGLSLWFGYEIGRRAGKWRIGPLAAVKSFFDRS